VNVPVCVCVDEKTRYCIRLCAGMTEEMEFRLAV